jgi:hypothetical protein
MRLDFFFPGGPEQIHAEVLHDLIGPFPNGSPEVLGQ